MAWIQVVDDMVMLQDTLGGSGGGEEYAPASEVMRAHHRIDTPVRDLAGERDAVVAALQKWQRDGEIFPTEWLRVPDGDERGLWLMQDGFLPDLVAAMQVDMRDPELTETFTIARITPDGFRGDVLEGWQFEEKAFEYSVHAELQNVGRRAFEEGRRVAWVNDREVHIDGDAYMLVPSREFHTAHPTDVRGMVESSYLEGVAPRLVAADQMVQPSNGPWIETTDTTISLVDTVAESELDHREVTVATQARGEGTEAEAVIAALKGWHEDGTVPAQRWVRTPDMDGARGWWSVDRGQEWSPATAVAHIDVRRELGLRPERSRMERARDLLPEGLASRLRERSERRDADAARQRHEDLRRRQGRTHQQQGRGL